MKDIALENNHLVLKNGDLKLVDGESRIKQHIVVGLRIIKGDWFLDYRAGIDYFNGLKIYSKILKAEIKDAISEVIGVSGIRKYSFKKDKELFKVSADVIASNQAIRIDEEFRL